jgi:hypothetical protein
MSETVVAADHPVADTWQPRDAAWLSRGPSAFAGQARRPLFVGACPRSGTTLLRSLLDNHPDLAMPAETNFVLPLWLDRKAYGDLRDPANRRRMAEWVMDTPKRGGTRIRGGGFSREEAIERVVAAPPTLGSVFAALFEMYADAKGKGRWGDKRPAYAAYISAIFRLFPDAQFINVVRDPRAAVPSQIAVGLHKAKNERMATAAAIATWEIAVRRSDAYVSRLRPDQLLDVRYEDLVRDPRTTLEQVCAFADLRTAGDAIDDMLNRPRRFKFKQGYHERVSQPISTDGISKWRETVPPRRVALIEAATGQYFERFGYRTVSGPRVTPRPKDVEALDEHRKRRQTKWRQYERAELKRRLLTYRKPVAAIPPAAGS